MSELDEFRATYFDECAELLLELEEQFSEIAEGDRGSDKLNAVFRAIHSIKGGAGAFNFTRLVQFAHNYETLLDHVRDGRVEMTDDVVALCLKSNDIVADFVSAAQEDRELAEDYGEEELARFKIMCGDEEDGEPMEEFDIDFTPVMVNLDGDDDAPGSPTAENEPDEFEESPMAANESRWELRFVPFSRLYERANDPLLLFRELATLGKIEIQARLAELPELAAFEAFGVYCSWDIALSGPGLNEERIKEVFEFVEGDCEIEIKKADTIVDFEVGPDAGSEPEPVVTADAIDISDLDAAAFGEPASDEGSDDSDELVADSQFDTETETDSATEAEPGKELSFADLAAELAPPAPVVTPPKTEAANADAATPAASRPAAMQSIRVDLDKVDRVVNMVGELVITQSMLTQQLDDTLKSRYQELVRGVEVLAQTTRGLQDAVMAIRAQPVKSVFSRMPRLVRELAGKTDKIIRLEMVGENTEIDKTIIEQLSDPLTHMIRNSADHGIEKPEIRKQAGKSEHGTIRLSAEQAGGSILISVQDDGGGINRERVLKIARERGVVGPDQTPSDEQIDELIFAPGFSTAEALSDISGRGVGMDVVISNIQKIGGSVHVKSWPGRGTRMQLRLPLTLAVLDVMLVEVAGSPYVVPLSSIVETMQSRKAEFGRTPSGRRVLQVRGEYVQVVDLAIRFGMNTEVDEHDRFVVLCEVDGDTKVAVVVDAIIGQQQVVIKSLEENFERIEGIAGGTILGDGSVALIVDVQGVRNTAEQKTAA